MVEEAWDDYEEGGTPELWRKLRTAWRKVEKARAGHDTAAYSGEQKCWPRMR